MENRTSSYEQMSESGDMSSAFDFSEKSIRHGSHRDHVNVACICFFVVSLLCYRVDYFCLARFLK